VAGFVGTIQTRRSCDVKRVPAYRHRVTGEANTLPWDPLELAETARQHLTADAATYFETTAVFPPTHHNEAEWAKWRFVPRVGRDVASVSTAVDLFGAVMAAPILLAPCAFAGHAHPDGELAVARAAATTATTYVVPSTATVPGDVARQTRGTCWLQLYVPTDAEQVASTLADATDAGFAAVVVTMDAPVASIRLHGYRPDRAAHDPLARSRPHASPLNPSVTWSTIERIVGLTSLPVLVKGVLHPDDARAAFEHGAAGVIVSNHGERQLDGVVPTAVALEAIASAATGYVLVDGGIRNGRDVLRALCLGADAVLIGRPYLWALAIAGEAGVAELLVRFRVEFENALALTGCRSAAEADRALLRYVG
jgi:isopentenyl diphosphate isomerase/L-lactate dehydrogenase-like FMN-dependent dehydrogenase